MFQAEIEIMKAIAASGGVSHYKSLAQIRFEYKAGLSNLVEKGFVSAYGSKIWTEALFSLTPKGREALDKFLRDNPSATSDTNG